MRKDDLEFKDLLDEGISYIQSKDFSNAKIVLNEALEIKPDNDVVFYYLGLLEMYQDNLDKAIVHYQKAITINPKFFDSLINLSYSLRLVGRFKDALDTIDKALAIEDDVDWHLNRGLILQDLGKDSEALHDYQLYLGKYPNSIPALGLSGRILETQKQYVKALEMYNQILNIDPEHAIAYFDKAVVLNALFKYDEALNVMEKVLEYSKAKKLENPAYFNLLTEKGNLYYNLHRYEESIICYDESLRLKPDYQYALLMKSESHYALQEYEKSIQLLDYLLTLNPNSVNYIEKKNRALKTLQTAEEILELNEK